MTEKKKTIAFGVLFAAAVIAAWFFYSRFAANRSPGIFASSAQTSEALRQAPDFTVYTEDGKKVKLSDFRGKPVILNFWASWCYYCKQEMPEFASVYAKEKDKIQFLFVDWVGGSETKDSAKSYLKEQKIELPVYYDLYEEAVAAYGLRGIPATFFIDKNGNLAGGVNQMIDRDTLEQAVEYLKKN